MKTYTCVFLFLWATAAWSQSADSLRQQLRMAQSDTARLRLYSELGNLFTLTDDFDSVTTILRKAWPLASKVGTINYMGRFYFLQGMVYRAQGLFGKSIVTFQRSLALTTPANDRVWMSYGRYLIAVAHTDKADYKQAIIQSMSNLAYAEKQRATRLIYNSYALLVFIYDKINNKALVDYYQAKFMKMNPNVDMARASRYEARGNLAAAWPYLKKMVADVKSRKVKSKNDIIFMLTWAAKNLRSRRESSEALRYLQEAFQTDRGRGDAGALSWVWEELSQVRLQLGQPQAALQAAQEAVRLARLDKPTELVLRLVNLSMIQQATGHYQQALLTYQEYHTLKESLLSLEKTQQIAQIQAYYDLDQKEHNILLLKKNAQFQAQQLKMVVQQRLGLGLGVLVLLLGVGTTGYFLRQLRGQKMLIQTQLQQVQQAVKLRDKLFAIISHDLRSPVASLLFGLQLLQRRQPQMAGLRDLESQVSRVYETMDNLLYWSLSQQQGLRSRLIRFSLNDLVEEVLGNFDSMIEEKDLTIVYTSNGSSYVVLADENMSLICLRNLLHNAIKFTPVQGSIRIWMEPAGSEIILRIADSGVGMKPVNQGLSPEGIIQSGHGTGLGLVVTDELMRQQQGRLAIESEWGKGTTVTLMFQAE